ncbi:MAG: TfoX/Sxy family protein [Alphaproteobacteria bacterium]
MTRRPTLPAVSRNDDASLWIEDLFRPHLAISLRRMFCGTAVFTGDGPDRRMVALEADGELWFKCDDQTAPQWEAAGAEPFRYAKADGVASVMSYRRLPEEALDDTEVFARWVKLADAASRRAARTKARPRTKGKTTAKIRPHA